MTTIRLEAEDDFEAVREILIQAFGGKEEAELLEALRESGDLVLALVAEEKESITGQIAFSRLWVEQGEERHPAVALAPLAVAPDRNGRGLATRLVREAHACLAAMGESLSVVLGEPEFYSQFGYTHGRAARFESKYQSPYLQAVSFRDAPGSGALRYPEPFNRF